MHRHRTARIGTALATFVHLTLLTTVAGCVEAPPSDDAVSDDAVTARATVRTVTPSKDQSHQHLAALFGVTRVDADDEATVRLYEIGGGDALNGDHLWLGVSAPGAEEIWDTGVNVRSVESVILTQSGAVQVLATSDDVDPASGDAHAVDVQVGLRYGLRGGLLGKDLVVDAPATAGGTRMVPSDASAPAAFLNRVYGMKGVERDGLVARVFEVAPTGDPAMNGDHLFLSVDAPAPWTYELGLDVATLTTARFAAAGELVLEGTVDRMGRDGVPQSKPFSTKIGIALARAGSPATVKVTVP